MIERDESMARLLDRAAPEPPRLLDPAAIRGARGRSTRPRIVRVLAPVLAAVVVAGVAGAVALSRGGEHSETAGTPPSAPDRSPSLTATHPPSTQHLSAELREIADRLLAGSGVPQGARVVSTLPGRSFDGPRPSGAEPAVIRRTRFWIIDATPADVERYVVRHRPGGLQPSVGGETAGGRGPYGELYLADTRWQPRNAAVPAPEVWTSVADLGHGRTGLRIDVQIHVDPRRPEQTIPDSVTGATVVVTSRSNFGTRPLRHTVRSSIGKVQADALGRAINTLAVRTEAPVVTGCLAELASIDVTVIFSGPGPTRAVRLDQNPCFSGDGVTVSVDSRALSPVLSAGVIRSQIYSAIGLPADYGRR